MPKAETLGRLEISEPFARFSPWRGPQKISSRGNGESLEISEPFARFSPLQEINPNLTPGPGVSKSVSLSLVSRLFQVMR